MFVGFGFKVASAPFHIWTPDVYEGSPTPVTAFMSAGPKAAAFAVFLRVFLTALEPAGGWFWLLWISAVLSMFVGNLAALVQSNIKRMLAYSSIAHAGYMLVAFAARSELGVAAVLFYLAAYCAMNLGAFAVGEPFRQRARALHHHRRLHGAGPPPSGAGCGAHHFSAVADWHPADPAASSASSTSSAPLSMLIWWGSPFWACSTAPLPPTTTCGWWW